MCWFWGLINGIGNQSSKFNMQTNKVRFIEIRRLHDDQLLQKTRTRKSASQADTFYIRYIFNGNILIV